MKTIKMSTLLLTIMALAFFYSARTTSCFTGHHNSAAITVAHNAASAACVINAIDPGSAGEVLAGGQSCPCVSSPAYTDYIDVHKVPCRAGDDPKVTPRVMGSFGY